MDARTGVVNAVQIVWHRDLGVYIASCPCGWNARRDRLSRAEAWATGHRCKETTMKRPPAIEDMLGVWDAQGPYPLRSTHEVAQLVAWVKTLEQRNAAAATHIDRARIAIGATAAGYDATLAVDTELCAALDVLAGDA